MARAEVKHLAVKPSTHQRYKIISAIKGKEIGEVADFAIKALEEKWGITLPVKPVE